MKKIYTQDILKDLDFSVEDDNMLFDLKQERKKVKKKLKKAHKKGKSKKIKRLKKLIRALDERCRILEATTLALTNGRSNKSSIDWGRLINDCAPKFFEILAENYSSKKKHHFDDDEQPEQFFTTKKK